MKKRLVMTMLVLAAFWMMAVGSGSSDGATKEITDAQTGEVQETAATEESEEAVADAAAVTIEEQILINQDDIIITAKELSDDTIWGTGVNLLIENNSAVDVGIGCNAVIVNNYMITDLFSTTVAAGKKVNETMYLSSTDLEAVGIENIGQIEIYFHTFNSDSYTTIADYDKVTIQTSAYDTMDVKAMDDGKELVNQNGIRIVGKYVTEDSFWGAAVLLYIENTSGKNVSVSCDDMSINGFMMTPYFSSTVYDGKMAVDEITLMSSELEENGITSIDDIELKFRVYDADSYSTIFETEAISFSAQ